jgi:hypothetical protein
MLKTPQYVLNNQGDKDREKAHISKYKNGQLNKEGESMVFTSSKSRHFIKVFSYDLLPLDTLLISVRLSPLSLP